MRYFLLLFALITSTVFADAPLIWDGSQYGRFLSPLGWRLSDLKQYRSLTVDPSAGAGLVAPIGSVGVRDNGGSGEMWVKTAAGNTAWSNVLSSATGWSLLGNAGTNAAVNFLGTTDAVDLVLRANNTEYLRITSAGAIDTTLGLGIVHSSAAGILSSSAVNLASADVTGILPLANGGTNKLMVASNGAVAYSDADSLELSAVGSVGQVLQSGGAGAPTWSTPTYPSASGAAGQILRSDGTNNVYSTATFPNTATQYDLLYASAANVWSSLAKQNSSALVSSAAGVPSWASGSTANRLLRTDGTTVSFAQADLTTDVTGVLPVANGGTNKNSWTAGSIVFAGAGGTALQEDTGFPLSWDDTNNRFNIGAAGTARLNVTSAGGADLGISVFSTAANNAVQIQNQSGYSVALVNAAASAVAGASIGGAFSRGTLAAKTQSLAGDQLFSLSAQGYTGAVQGPGLSGAISIVATENTTATANGGSLVFSTTPNTTLVPVSRMTIGQNGVVNISNLTASLPVQTDASKNLVSAAITLSGAQVTGVLPVANGGTNSSTALNNNRIIQSSGGAIVESAAITANRALASNASGIPVASAVTDTELGYLSGVTSAVQTQLNGMVKRDGSTALTANWNVGAFDITAQTFIGPLTGNASTATALAANPTDCADAFSFANSIVASGNLTCISIAPVTSAIAALDIDWSVVKIKGGLFTKTLSANSTFTFSNLTSGQTIIVRLTNTASNYTVTWPTVKWAGGAAPTMTVGAKSDVYTFVYDGTDVFGSYVQNLF